MYPNLYFLLLDLFGWDIPAFKLVNSFGLMVALAFVVAGALLKRELKRKEAEGLLQPTESQQWVGKRRRAFGVGFKCLFLACCWGGRSLGYCGMPLPSLVRVVPPQQHLFSGDGYPLMGRLRCCMFGIPQVPRRHGPKARYAAPRNGKDPPLGAHGKHHFVCCCWRRFGGEVFSFAGVPGGDGGVFSRHHLFKAF